MYRHKRIHSSLDYLAGVQDAAGIAEVGQSGDEGIDGIIKEDKLGLDALEMHRACQSLIPNS